MLKVGNVRSYKGDMTTAAYCGRPSPYGNPFRIGGAGVTTRRQAIALFRQYWYAPENEPLRQRARRELLHREWLLCWCAPEGCHVEIIVEYLNGEIARSISR